ncbi:MAG: recombinase RecT [Janthinobacterium lividum]
MSNSLQIVTGAIEESRTNFAAVLTDRSISFDREAGFAMQILGNNDYALKVAAGNRKSVIDAVTNVAAIGISLNPARKQAYLVPRGGRICLDISYMGLLDLAVASGSIMWGQAELVREQDAFRRQGLDKAPHHEFDEFAKDRGAIVGVYVTVKTRDGDYLTTTMSIDDCYAIRDRSESWKNGQKGPWKTDPGEMIKKTVIKRASKLWPKTDRLAEAMALLNNENGEGLGGPESAARPADWVDVAPYIAEAVATTTDGAALKYWKENNAAFVNQPQDHKRLKDAVSNHRANLAEDAARTVEMPVTPKAVKTAPPPAEVPPMDDGFLAAMDAGADEGSAQ